LRKRRRIEDKFRELAASLEISAAGLAIAWVLGRGDHLIPIPGTRTPEHLEELLEGAQFEMTQPVLDEIDRIMPCGFAHGDRYSMEQLVGVERYC